MIDQYITYIGTLGFPIVVCIWFMARTEKVIKANTEVLYLIKDRIKK